MDKLVEMVEDGAVIPSFPALNYTYRHSGPTATAEVEEKNSTSVANRTVIGSLFMIPSMSVSVSSSAGAPRQRHVAMPSL